MIVRLIIITKGNPTDKDRININKVYIPEHINGFSIVIKTLMRRLIIMILIKKIISQTLP